MPPTGALRGWLTVAVAAPLMLAACESQTKGDPRSPSTLPSSSMVTSEPPPPVLMPDLLGIPSVEARGRLGELEGSFELGLLFEQGRPVAVRCGLRPGAVAFQHPAPATPLEHGSRIAIRLAALNLETFRGPCEPADADLGPVVGPDAALARQFYRFAANPALGAPFASGEVWTGIEDGLAATRLDDDERAHLAAWRLHTSYAERGGPFSALDIVAGSGTTSCTAASCPPVRPAVGRRRRSWPDSARSA